MASKKLDQTQVDFIIENHQEYTAVQMSVKLNCALWQIYSACAENKIKPLKPKNFKGRLTDPPSLLTNKFRSTAKTMSEISEGLVRPPALYSNASPYGIASEIHK